MKAVMGAARYARYARAALACSVIAWACPMLRDLVESRMSLHMLVQFPLLIGAGAGAAATATAMSMSMSMSSASAGQARTPAGVTRILPDTLDAGGLTAAVLLSAVTAFWMIPVALDAALLVPAMNAAKYLGLWTAGALLGVDWRRMASGLRLFLLGNLAWMLATAGLLYRQAEQRLCVNYLMEEQAITGNGLIAMAIGLVVIATWDWLRPPARPPGPSARPASS